MLAADHPAARSGLLGSGPQTIPLPAADHPVKGHEPPAASNRPPRCRHQAIPLPAVDHPAAGSRAIRCQQQTAPLRATSRPLLAADHRVKGNGRFAARNRRPGENLQHSTRFAQLLVFKRTGTKPRVPRCFRWNGDWSARRAKENSPAIYRWVSGRKGNESRQGRKNTRVLPHDFFRPCGACACLGIGCPPLKRWAIFGRPCGTAGLLDWPVSCPARARVPQPTGRKTIAQRFIAGFPGARKQ